MQNEEASDYFLDQYNKEIDEAEAEIDSGNYISNEDVEKLIGNRRNESVK
ncbi:MAG: hypothetical protein M3O71_26405 [Bacteroidota bacterium]|nr:hypothetical protein [Bacteroidota bacterium]